MTRAEIQLAQRDFAELRELIKGKTLVDLITEIRSAEDNHSIGICNILDADAGSVEDIGSARMMDVNYKSLNPTICLDDNGQCTIDSGNPSIEIYSWYDEEKDDTPIGYLTYEEITDENLIYPV